MPQPIINNLNNEELTQRFEDFCRTSAVKVNLKKSEDQLDSTHYIDVYTTALFKFFKAGVHFGTKEEKVVTTTAALELKPNSIYALTCENFLTLDQKINIANIAEAIYQRYKIELLLLDKGIKIQTEEKRNELANTE